MCRWTFQIIAINAGISTTGKSSPTSSRRCGITLLNHVAENV